MIRQYKRREEADKQRGREEAK